MAGAGGIHTAKTRRAELHGSGVIGIGSGTSGTPPAGAAGAMDIKAAGQHRQDRRRQHPVQQPQARRVAPGFNPF